MASVSVILPDSSEKHFEHSPSVLEVAQSIGPRLAAQTVGALINDDPAVRDLRTHLQNGDRLKIITEKSPEALEVIRHSAAHVMAQAVQELWPDVKVTIGPVIDNGFYYDFASPRPFAPEDLEKIEQKMTEIIGRDLAIIREEMRAEDATQLFVGMNESYKVEIIRDLNVPTVSVYRQGEWLDLCRGPHVQRTGQIGAIKVLSLAGAYWRGDETKAQLQRIYATAFTNKKDLQAHLDNLEEAKRRDHRKLGKELGLFHFHPLAPGSPFFAPRGAVIYNELQNFMRELYRARGYEEVITPQVFDVDLFHKSGHYENYRENMYFTEYEERSFSLKPMNCPGHCVLFGMDRHSYRELPIRMADFGRLHRLERSGALHGLNRVRSFCQDDAHIFCTMEQLQDEIRAFMEMLDHVYKTLGMERYIVYLSTRPPKRMGSDEIWDQAEGVLKQALTELKIPYHINAGDGAFYGPKLDIMFVDAIQRPWQLGTLQVDFNLPLRFDLNYVGEDNQEHHPIMLHRAILGSLERFIGVYLEHCAGHLPTWLSPVQAKILTITDAQLPYGREVQQVLQAAGVRAELDSRGEKLGFKIREAQLERVPYMLVLGQKEMEQKTVAIRRSSGDVTDAVKLNEFVATIRAEVAERRFPGLRKVTEDKH